MDHTAPQFCVNSYWSGSSGFFPLPEGSANWSGSYRDDLSGVVAMTVDGYRPVLTPGTGNGGTWVIPDSRSMVLPDFDVTMVENPPVWAVRRSGRAGELQPVYIL